MWIASRKAGQEAARAEGTKRTVDDYTHNLVADIFKQVNKIFRARWGAATEGRGNALLQRQYRFAEHRLARRASAFRAVLPEITPQVPCAIVYDLY